MSDRAELSRLFLYSCILIFCETYFGASVSKFPAVAAAKLNATETTLIEFVYNSARLPIIFRISLRKAAGFAEK